MLNLDYICMKHAQQILRNERILRKALGVLEEDGVYAMFLWLEKNKKNNSPEEKIRRELTDLLNDGELREILGVDKFRKDFDEFTEDLLKVASDIKRLLLLKRILQRTLTYALYHAGID